jgi:hypothetical protein
MSYSTELHGKMIMKSEQIRFLKKRVVTYFMAYLAFTHTDSAKPVSG